MKLNIFEGARRITILSQAAFVLTVLSVSFFNNPYVRLVYETTYPNGPFVYAKDQDCDFVNDASESIDRKTSKGKEIPITLCYRGMPFPDGEILIPFKNDESGMVWGNGKYSPEVLEYTKKRTTFFQLPKESESMYRKTWWGKKFENIWGGIKTAIIGYLSILVFSFVLGWIVRGFMGIERGQDHRLQKSDAQ